MRVGPPRTDFALRTVVIGDHAIASAASATDTMWRAEGDGPQFGPHDDPTTGPTRESESQGYPGGRAEIAASFESESVGINGPEEPGDGAARGGCTGGCPRYR